MKYLKILVSFLFFSVLLGFVLAAVFLVFVRSNKTEPLSASDLQSDVKSRFLKELLTPQDTESWLQGDMTSAAGPIDSQVVFIAFWSRSETGSFLIADRLNQLNYHSKERIYGFFVELPVGAESPSNNNFKLKKTLQSSNAVFPVFYDTQLRIWKAFGSQAWPLVIAFDQRNNAILKSWSASSFLSEDLDTIAQTFQGLKPNSKNAAAASTELIEETSGTLDLSTTVFSKQSEISAAVASGVGYFVSDSAANRILWIDNKGLLKLTIGSGNPGFKDGQASEAQFRFPGKLAFSEREKVLYIVDLGNAALRTFNIISGELATIPLVAAMSKQKQFIPGDIALIRNRLFVTSVFTDEIFYSDRSKPELNFRKLPLPDSQIVPMAVAKSREFNVLYIVDQLTRDLFVYDLGTDELRKISNLKNFGFHSFQTLTVFHGEILGYLSNEHGQELLNLYNVKSSTFGQALLDGAESESIGLVSSFQTVIVWSGTHRKICADHNFDALKVSKSFQTNPDPKTQRSWFTKHSAKGLFVLPTGASYPGPSDDLAARLGKVSLGDCMTLPAAKLVDESAQIENPHGLVPIKAGIKARFQILLQPLDGYVFSNKEVHTVKTPDGKMSFWNPFMKGLLEVNTPVEPGIGEIQLDTVMCKKADQFDCMRKKFRWNIDAKLTFPTSEFALGSSSNL